MVILHQSLYYSALFNPKILILQNLKMDITTPTDPQVCLKTFKEDIQDELFYKSLKICLKVNFTMLNINSHNLLANNEYLNS